MEDTDGEGEVPVGEYGSPSAMGGVAVENLEGLYAEEAARGGALSLVFDLTMGGGGPETDRAAMEGEADVALEGGGGGVAAAEPESPLFLLTHRLRSLS